MSLIKAKWINFQTSKGKLATALVVPFQVLVSVSEGSPVAAVALPSFSEVPMPVFAIRLLVGKCDFQIPSDLLQWRPAAGPVSQKQQWQQILIP